MKQICCQRIFRHIHGTAWNAASLPRYTFAVKPPGQPFNSRRVKIGFCPCFS